MIEIKPREKALDYGIESLSNQELLALILRSGYQNKSVLELASELLEKANGIENLCSFSYEELIRTKGLGKAKALELLAIIEISKRLTRVNKVSSEDISNPGKLVDWIRFNVGFSSQEEFFVLYISSSGNVIKHEVLFKGTKSSSLVGIDIILRRAILLKAANIVVAHNHPGGNISPSKDDIKLTRQLKESCDLMGIRLLDHLIITKSEYYSFNNSGLIN